MKYRLLGLLVLQVILVGCVGAAAPAAPTDGSAEKTATPLAQGEDPPSRAPNPDSGLPPSVQALPSKYQEAYRLLPSGPWAQRYYQIYFVNGWDEDAYQALDDIQPANPVRVAPTTLSGAQEEQRMVSMMEDASSAAWVQTQVERSGEGAWSVIAESETPLDGFRKLAALGWSDQIFMIGMEWELRKQGASEDLIGKILQGQKLIRESTGALAQLSPKQQVERMWETRVCVMVLAAWNRAPEYPYQVLTDGGCDIDGALKVVYDSIASRGGAAIITEEDFQQRVEAEESRAAK